VQRSFEDIVRSSERSSWCSQPELGEMSFCPACEMRAGRRHFFCSQRERADQYDQLQQ
jgi:hypothetical protein